MAVTIQHDHIRRLVSYSIDVVAYLQSMLVEDGMNFNAGAMYACQGSSVARR